MKKAKPKHMTKPHDEIMAALGSLLSGQQQTLERQQTIERVLSGKLIASYKEEPVKKEQLTASPFDTYTPNKQKIIKDHQPVLRIKVTDEYDNTELDDIKSVDAFWGVVLKGGDVGTVMMGNAVQISKLLSEVTASKKETAERLLRDAQL